MIVLHEHPVIALHYFTLKLSALTFLKFRAATGLSAISSTPIAVVSLLFVLRNFCYIKTAYFCHLLQFQAKTNIVILQISEDPLQVGASDHRVKTPLFPNSKYPSRPYANNNVSIL